MFYDGHMAGINGSNAVIDTRVHFAWFIYYYFIYKIKIICVLLVAIL
jgi:hypothetical protein